MGARKITEITGKITTADGVTREFAITADLGWQQWGATTEHLGDTVTALEAMTRALGEESLFASDDDEAEEDDDA